MLTHEQHQLIIQCSRDETASQQVVQMVEHLLAEAEKKLNRERERHRALFERTNDAVFWFDRNGYCFSANQRAADMMGCTLEEIYGIHRLEFIAPEEHQKSNQMTALIQSGIIPPVYERIFRRKDGTCFASEVNAALISDDRGDLVYMQSIVRDISERKRLEDELEREHNLLSSLINAVPDEIYVKDRQSRFMLANRAVCEKLRVASPEEVMGKNDLDFGHPAAQEFFTAEQEVMSSGKPIINTETKVSDLFAAPGKTHMLITKVPLRDENGEVIGLVGINRNISQIKDMQEALRENQRFVEQITQTIPDIVYVVDIMTERNIYANRSVADVLGYTVEQVQALGEDFVEHLMHPEDRVRQKIAATRFAEAKDGDVVESEYRWKHANGDWRWLFTRETVFTRSPDGSPCQILGIAQDVTGRKHAEGMQLENDRLHIAFQKEQELNTLKNKMMERIAHEFRTPLTVISTSTEMIQRYQDRMSPHQRADHVERIQSQIARLALMIDQISFIIRSINVIEPELKTTNLRDVCSQDIQNKTLEQQHRIMLTAPDDLPALQADEMMLQRMFDALLDNALQYSTSPVHVALCVDGDALRLDVTDRGVGIPDIDLPLIFEPFYRGSNLEQVKGIGLGLSIVKGVVKLHNGSVTVKSKLNKGTTISVHLPLHRPE